QDVVRRAIARGVGEGHFGYCSGTTPKLGSDGAFEVAPDKVRCGVTVSDDEIDLDSGFIMLPAAIPTPEPVPVPTPTGSTPGGTGAVPPAPTPPPGAKPPTPTPPEQVQTEVQLSFSADRD